MQHLHVCTVGLCCWVCLPVDSFYASLLQKTVTYVVTTDALEEMTALTRSHIFRKVHISFTAHPSQKDLLLQHTCDIDLTKTLKSHLTQLFLTICEQHQTLVYVLKHWFYSLADSLDPRCPDVLNPQNPNGENAVAARRRITAHISMKKEKSRTTSR